MTPVNGFARLPPPNVAVQEWILTERSALHCEARGEQTEIILRYAIPQHQALSTLISDIRDGLGREVTPVLLLNAARQREIDVSPDDVECILTSPPTWGLEFYAKEMAERFNRIEMERNLSEALSMLKGRSPLEAVADHLTACTSELVTPKAATGFVLEPLTSAEFFSGTYSIEYLIAEVLTASQPMVIGGRSKSLKTSIGIDLAISLATGREFLNRFAVHQTARVAFISGESGKATIQDTARRICECKQVEPKSLSILWEFRLPCLADARHQRELLRIVREHKIEVLFLDPVYLSLLDANLAAGASNVFAMGAALRPVAEMLAAEGATLILIHHCTKTAARNNTVKGEPPELEDLAMAGFAEFARQWLLIGRRKPYVDGTGLHELWVRHGGSAGHSGLIGVDVREGTPKDLGGRHWAVTARDPQECWAEHQTQAESTATSKQDAKDEKACIEVLKVITEGANTTRSIRNATHMGAARVERILGLLERRGEIEITTDNDDQKLVSITPGTKFRTTVPDHRTT